MPFADWGPVEYALLAVVVFILFKSFRDPDRRP